MSESTRLHFENLPLVEAAIRVSFATPIDVDYANISSVHESIKTQFPSARTPDVTEGAPGRQVQTITLGQPPGVVFSGDPSGVRITAQPPVVVTRWTRQPTRAGPDYPGYEAVKKAHWDVVRHFAGRSSESKLKCSAVNISYTNFLQIESSPEVLGKLFSKRIDFSIMKDGSQFQKMEVAWQDSKGTDTRLRIERVTAESEGQVIKGCVLTTIAGTGVQDLAKAEQALDGVHQHLQGFFLSIISDAAKAEWGLKKCH